MKIQEPEHGGKQHGRNYWRRNRGLTAALALVRRNIEVAVYEQAPRLNELGAGMQISSNGTRVLYALGLGPSLEGAGVAVAGKEIRLWSTGQNWKLFDLGAQSIERYGFPYMMFHRGDLHAALLGAIQRESSRARSTSAASALVSIHTRMPLKLNLITSHPCVLQL